MTLGNEAIVTVCSRHKLTAVCLDYLDKVRVAEKMPKWFYAPCIPHLFLKIIDVVMSL